ncbi:MAG: hypothetical protein AAGD04_06740, partial [Pseudomonadota bacterium]
MTFAFGRLFAFLAVFSLATEAHAQDAPLGEVPGSETARFQETVALWLSGEDDLLALKSMASLANAKNIAAQILLSQIATDGPLHAHVTAKLARKERIALLRKDGGISGTSWLLVAAKENALAKAMLEAKQVGNRVDGILVLFELGETRRALRASVALMHEGRLSELIETLAKVEDLPDEADWLLATAYQTILLTNIDYVPSVAAKERLAGLDLDNPAFDTSFWNPTLPERYLNNEP